ncbi:hypothetical protein EDD16DRAFT_1670695 [Pisolithus croceorrhizus]|nr:hypothetical protein EDD16DRAFT_1670695 [Pisolithus croceorrhizus]KAI6126416.1 hypothetical protein EV401DRAFT_1934454 [Pisolithus croceorrhizus]KAI6164625.1 hypothetical protein EDD17DRAFT_1561599 [Pisolithus thermaeus]
MASVHLLVLIHGMWGNPSHLTRVHEIIQAISHYRETSDPPPLTLVLVDLVNNLRGP